MERARRFLQRGREALIERWDRQLRAAAEVGFRLDPGTVALLPLLLDRAEHALERRFRPVDPDLPAAQAEARRAAMRASLLTDYLLDAVREELRPDPDQERILAAGLTHAVVEALVFQEASRRMEERRRDAERLTRLTHEMRDSMTAARLSTDLLIRRGGLPPSGTALTLLRNLSRLQDAVEDSLLDDLIEQNQIRKEPIELTPLLETARVQCDPGARQRGVSLEVAAAPLRLLGDSRILGPAVRALVRTAIELSSRGGTVRLLAARQRGRARLAVRVERCKPASKRAPGSQALLLATRAARAQGGSLREKSTPPALTFTLELPVEE